MRRKLTLLAMCCAAIGVTAVYHVAKLHATPAVGFVGTTLALGRFGPIDVSNVYVPPDYPAKHKNGIWLSLMKTRNASDVYVQSNVWQPGGSTGWHTHPGASLIVVTAGTVTAYEGNDPKCQPHVYTTGAGFVDAGGDHVHILRNEGTVEAQTIAVQLIPAGTTRRIDANDPGNCHF
jgi:hypothetical protein